jgi:hypothetical protein
MFILRQLHGCVIVFACVHILRALVHLQLNYNTRLAFRGKQQQQQQ